MPTRATTITHLAPALVRDVSAATAAAPKEASLRAVIETHLGRVAEAVGVPWSAHTLDNTLRGAASGTPRFVDAAHGAVVLEYEPPNAFRGGRASAVLAHARGQAEENAVLLAAEEGRPEHEYVLVAWDGADITFGRLSGGIAEWEALHRFDEIAAERLIAAIQQNGVPLVYPALLAELVGPDSPIGQRLLPLLFASLRDAIAAGGTTKSVLLFTEWKRLFGQVVGAQSDALRDLLTRQGHSHGEDYAADPGAYLFALNTLIAVVAKVVAALSLTTGEILTDRRVSATERMRRLEAGELFELAGVENMLAGQDFFAWYLDDPAWSAFEPEIDRLLTSLSTVSFDVRRKNIDSVRDLFKGLYMSFVPRALRHALGEYYTPDWLAEHVLDRIDWQPGDDLLDPTCGSGTFLLEAVRRRLTDPGLHEVTAEELLSGLYGLDLNPLGVLSTRASLVVFLSPRLGDPTHPLRLPVYLADAINATEERDGSFEHRLQTERGERTFRVPARIVRDPEFFALFARLRLLIDSGAGADAILQVLKDEFGSASWTDAEVETLHETIDRLVELHTAGWNGIWVPILAERFTAGAIGRVSHVAGNPPWVKWSHLPPEYAQFIKPQCTALGVFSEDVWVGGIESDISTVITYVAAQRWLADGGVLAFLITGTVFVNESSQGFRRFVLPGGEPLSVQLVEDYKDIRPFEGVSNHPTLLIFRRGDATAYPVPYTVWRAPDGLRRGRRRYLSALEFRSSNVPHELLAQPVPGTDAGPWLKGTAEQHELWAHLFGGAAAPGYQARKGITTDANGIFFVNVAAEPRSVRVGLRESLVTRIRTDPREGRRSLPVRAADVEDEHLFALLRGEGVTRFRAAVDQHAVLVPQRGMHGDANLPTSAPRTYRFLAAFQAVLESRGSFRRFQRGKPYWSLWSVGPYSFADFKVAWREMSGSSFAAAVVEPTNVPRLGRRTVVPDHKVYFVPCASLEEASYLAAILNARDVAEAVSAYAASLSLGASVVEYLRIPRYDSSNPTHQRAAQLGRKLTRFAAEGQAPSTADEAMLNEISHRILGVPTSEPAPRARRLAARGASEVSVGKPPVIDPE